METLDENESIVSSNPQPLNMFILLCVCVFWGSLGGLWSRQYSISHLKNQQVSPDINQPDLSTVFATHIGELILFLLYSDPGLFVYCCDFSSTAVDLVKVSDRKLHYPF